MGSRKYNGLMFSILSMFPVEIKQQDMVVDV
jgi:hypothetical protein